MKRIYLVGMGIHYERKLIYFVDTEGTIKVLENVNVGDEDANSSSQVRVFHQSMNQAQALSVDWLNNQLYLAEDDQVRKISVFWFWSQHASFAPHQYFVFKKLTPDFFLLLETSHFSLFVAQWQYVIFIY